MNAPQTLALALQHHQAGRMAEAEALYRQILALQPDHAEAWHLLGVLAHQIGRHDVAVKLIERSISLAPRNSSAHSNLGEAHRSLGQDDAAIACYRRAIEIDPRYFVGHFNLANLLRVRNQFDEAIDEYRQALALKPDHAEALNNLGLSLAEKEEFAESVFAYERALALNPSYVDARVNLANAFKAQHRLDEAVTEYREALRQKPDLAEGHNNLGNALREQGHSDEAAAEYREALRLRPDYAQAHGNLGLGLFELGKFDEAITCYRTALKLDPRLPDGHFNLGVAGLFRGEFSQAETAFREAIAGGSDLADVHLNLGILLLLFGRYEEGWREYQWRWRSPRHAYRRRIFSAPIWDGSPIPGKTLLVHVEQGLGDTLHFLRYLPLIIERANARHIVLECYSSLVPFLAQLETAQLSVVAQRVSDSALPPFDMHLPLLDTPLLLGCFEPLPLDPSLLQACPPLRSQWRERVGRGAQFRVGLAWTGNPRNDNDRRRSIPADLLAPLLRVPGLSFISLQVEPAGPLPSLLAEHGVLDAKPHISSFADSAALIAELDLVITVDTAVAHLAGTLGVPVWTLLPFVPDWRWGLESEQTPWYPAMRLFRQTKPGNWEDVIQRVTQELSSTTRETLQPSAHTPSRPT